MADINAKEKLVRTVLSKDYIYHIPLYQRPYSWEDNQVMELYEDLYGFWQKHKNDDKNYFLGSIVLVKEPEESNSDVIDGQQRLTTLSIIFSILWTKASNGFKDSINGYLWEEGDAIDEVKASPRLNLRKADAEFFEKYILNHQFERLFQLGSSSITTDSQNLLRENSKALYDSIQRDFGDNSSALIDEFAKFIAKRCYIVVVTTPDEETAYEVFSVLNNRGLSLLPSDIIKGEILSKISKAQQQEYTEKWEDTENEIGRDNFNQLLSHIRMIYAKSKLQGTLVKEFTKYVTDSFSDSRKLIDEVILPYSRVYTNILKQDGNYEMETAAIREYFMWLGKIGDSYWLPPVMKAFVRYQSDYQFLLEFIKKFERLAAYLFLTNQSPNKRIDRYGKIISALNRDKDYALETMELEPKEQNEFIERLNSDVYLMSSQKRKYAICRLDSFILAGEYHKIYEDTAFTIEHILPQNPKKDSEWVKKWPDSNIRNEWLNKVANLALLTKSTNSEVSNSDFSVKKDKYIHGKYGANATALISQILALDEWTPEIVEKRQNELMAVYMEHWDLKQTSTMAGSNSADTTNTQVIDNSEKEAAKTREYERMKSFKTRMKAFVEKLTGDKLIPMKDVKQKKPEKDFVAEKSGEAYCILPSKTYDMHKYWYGYSRTDSEVLGKYRSAKIVFGSIEDERIIVLPYKLIEDNKDYIPTSPKRGTGTIQKWHIYLRVMDDGGIFFLVPQSPVSKQIDVSQYVIEMKDEKTDKK